jgi:phage terminase small subunit
MTEPLEFLLRVMRGDINANPSQLKAAVAAAQYLHTKRHDGGKKEAAKEKASIAAEKFGARPSPLKLVG